MIKKYIIRLKMVDADGKYSYSNVVLINSSVAVRNLSIYPNPVKGLQVFISLDESVSSDISIKIEDVSGRIYNKYILKRNDTNRNIPVNIKNLSSGTYLIKAETSKKLFIQQVNSSALRIIIKISIILFNFLSLLTLLIHLYT
ncbi:MAG: T9SS type A sorting domain-containing protein [Segetibacter sp.]